MPELISRADANQAVVELLGERIAAALVDLDRVQPYGFQRTHDPQCWQWHAACLAARQRRTLTGEEAPDGV